MDIGPFPPYKYQPAAALEADHHITWSAPDGNAALPSTPGALSTGVIVRGVSVSLGVTKNTTA